MKIKPSFILHALTASGIRITLFEACSVFTHITACMFAKSLSEPSTPEASAASLPPRLLQLLPVGTKLPDGIRTR